MISNAIVIFSMVIIIRGNVLAFSFNAYLTQDLFLSYSSFRMRKPLTSDNIKNVTELFLKRECQFSEALHPSKRRYDFVFRERSIDDGSHYDPRLDKYPDQPKNHGTLQRKPAEEVKKNDKKFGSLKKVI